MNHCRTVLLAAALSTLSCKNTAPVPLKANATSILDAEGREQIRYEIESDPGTWVGFETGAENDQGKKEGIIEDNGRLTIVAPVWTGYEPKRKVGIRAKKTEKGLFDTTYPRTGYLEVVVTRTPRLLDGHCIVADHKCEMEVAVDAITVNGVEVGTIVAVGASQETATGDSVRVSIDFGSKVSTAIVTSSGSPDASSIPKVPFVITFPDGAKVQQDVTIALLQKLIEAFKAAESGRALRLQGEPDTGGARGMLFIDGDKKLKVIGSAATVADLDVVAKDSVFTRDVLCGEYISRDFRTAYGHGTAYIHAVSVWERRTGKSIANREFAPKESPCRAEVKTRMGSAIDAGKAEPSLAVIDDWLRSFIRR